MQEMSQHIPRFLSLTSENTQGRISLKKYFLLAVEYCLVGDFGLMRLKTLSEISVTIGHCIIRLKKTNNNNGSLIYHARKIIIFTQCYSILLLCYFCQHPSLFDPFDTNANIRKMKPQKKFFNFKFAYQRLNSLFLTVA